MNQSEWREKFLDVVSASCEEGREAVEYLRARRIHVGIKSARRSVGAFWLLSRSVYLNSAHYSFESSIRNVSAWALLIHEARHLQQGALTAFSIYGELDAWQVQLRVMKRISARPLDSILEEILSLPLDMGRENLRRARRLMTRFAGVMYGAYLYPLYPFHQELAYWLLGKKYD